jgi:hypothetical protein
MLIDRVIKFFTSLKLTVALLAFAIVLVFWGTLAQVEMGLYKAQNEFFRSFFVFWQPGESGVRIPVFPGGYMVGGLLVINLISAHLRYYQPGKKKFGIVLIHAGLVLLIVGQFLTDVLSRESILHLRHGETRNYSEAHQAFELAIVDTTDSNADKVVAIPGPVLNQGTDVRRAELPFVVRPRTYYPNSHLVETPTNGYVPVTGTTGIGANAFWRQLPHETAMNRRDMPSGIIELITPDGSAGAFLVSAFMQRPQHVTVNGRHYELSLRPHRFYKPYSIQLLEFRFDRYPGTQTPKNFSSRVRVRHPGTGEDREVLIKMNTPLRYKGETYYQSSYDEDEQGTVLQVVRNPGWLTPYVSCVLVSAGLVIQFLSHLFGYATKRRLP